jgi:nitrite reductase/ring-hydroxylating ferredoxin subunit
MAKFVPVAKSTELKPGEMKRVLVDGERVCLVNVDGTYYALRDQCGHQKAALSKGKLEGSVIECPLHFARFDVRTGKVLRGPDFGRLQLAGLEKLGPEAAAMFQRIGEIIADVQCEDVPTYQVRVQGDWVQVRL